MVNRGIEQTNTQPQAVQLGGDLVALEIDTTIYEMDALLRACYQFSDRCYIFLARCKMDPQLVVTSFATKGATTDLLTLAGDFQNELVDQQLRLILARETGPLRELIVAQAFSEGNLLDPQRDEGDYQNDPLGIGTSDVR